ncbi:hypothetical protein BDQ17DRAFT_1420724 [Cyathus striatus]|nr:hypothetical protein BDQ17DRAFT_1420724 [Cyathus striatus]
MTPIVEEVSDDDEAAEVDFYKVNIDELSDVMRKAGVKTVPTIHAYKAGRKIGEIVGLSPGEDLVVRYSYIYAQENFNLGVP